MCGILGSFGNLKKVEFIKSINLQKHRGPDDYGYFENDKFKLGHRRLSIIDVSEKSKQPMTSLNKRYTIVFNGEVYNFKEIKSQLKKKGVKFSSTGDTEVLLNGYIYYGEKILNYLRGMFALCIFDNKKKTFFIARDRVGIKPLYYYHKNGKFIFSSEIKSILNLVKKYTLNIDAVSSYISFRYPVCEQTFFNEIKELQPANYLKFQNNKILIKEYWSLKKLFLNKKKYSLQNSQKKLKKELEKSIKYRTISDVPVGAFLSGGLDSSLLVSIMSKKKYVGKKFNTYTVGIKKDPNEFRYANLIKKKYNLSHKEILIDRKKYLSSIKKLIGFKDAPLGIPNEILIYYMTKKMKKDITVVLSGEGADEIFAGYGRIYGLDEDYDKLKQNNKNKVLESKLLKKYKGLNFKNEFEHFLNEYKYFSLDKKKEFFKKKFKLSDIENKLKKNLKIHFPKSKKIDYFDSIMYFFLKVHVRGLLQRIDSMTMAASVEARVPFLDHEVIKTAINIPKKFKIKKLKNLNYENFISDEISEKKNITKYILKKTFNKILPKEIINRKKLGFPVSLENLFNDKKNINSLKKQFKKSIILNKLFQVTKIINFLENENKNHRDSYLVWMFINLDIFYKKFFISR